MSYDLKAVAFPQLSGIFPAAPVNRISELYNKSLNGNIYEITGRGPYVYILTRFEGYREDGISFNS